MTSDEEVCQEIGTVLVAALLGPESHLIQQQRAYLVGILLRQHLSAAGYGRQAPVIGPSLTEYFDAKVKLQGLPRP